MTKTKTNQTCPNLDQFQQLASGLLSADEMEPLLLHLESCDACAQKVKTLREPDTLVEMLRQRDTLDDANSRKIVDELVERLCKLRPEKADPATNERPSAI